MQRMHIHRPNWMHLHKPDWHTVGVRLDHLVHDPRFWAAVALAVLLGMMIMTMILSGGGSSGPYRTPIYPYMP